MISVLAQREPTRRFEGELDLPRSFAPGEPVRIGLVSDRSLEDVRLHYRRVNQGLRWQVAPMSTDGNRHEGTIPADYSRSDDHLQVYVTAREGGRSVVAPGLPDDLAGFPYAVILQQSP